MFILTMLGGKKLLSFPHFSPPGIPRLFLGEAQPTIKKNGERGIIQVALHFDKTGNHEKVVDFGTTLSQCHILVFNGLILTLMFVLGLDPMPAIRVKSGCFL